MQGHFPPSALEDAHALLKTGGHIVTTMRTMYWVQGQEEGYRDKFEELFAAGKLELVATKTFMRGVPGQTHGLFKEMESILLVCKRID